MKLTSLDQLFVQELKDLYSAENQLVEALPKMAQAASTDDLKQGFQSHLDQTRQHVDRLNQIFQDLDADPGGVKCEAMEGLISEGQEIIDADGEGAARDAALIAAAQKVEHYEIASYGTVRTYAKHLGNDKAQNLLHETLQEENATDEQLTNLAEGGAHINQMAAR